MLASFHFLRPGWLLMLLPVALLVLALWRRRGGDHWQRWVDPQLLGYLLEADPGRHSRWPLLGLALAWLLGVVALAGPSWERLPQPLFKTQQARVLILDLSPSMMAQDLKPSRLVLARHRLIDLIKGYPEGLTGLVVYAGDAHVLAPLSDDRQTLLALVPPLAPSIMPVSGSQVEEAVELAVGLLREGGHGRGELILVTDGVAASAEAPILELLQGQPYRLSILGVGTEQGAPVPQTDGSFAKQSDGAIYLARLDSQALAGLARRSGGRYQPLRFDGSDVEALLPSETDLSLAAGTESKPVERQFDLWLDAGPWLVLLLLPLAALAHRRGWLLLLVLVPMLNPRPVMALEWQQLWLNGDQRGARALAEGDPERAAQAFESPDWRGSALYQKGEYAQAAEAFAESLHPEVTGSAAAENSYNLGNALARSGELKQALEAYDRALAANPEMADSRFNRQLVEQLLDQQQQQEQQGQQNSQGEQGDGADNDGADQNSQGSEPEDRASGQNDDQNTAQNSGPEAGEAGEQNESPADPQRGSASEPGAEQQSEQPREQPPEQAQPQPEPSSESNDGGETGESQAIGDQQGDADDEELKRWLGQLPDDPGGLLRRKFEYQYRQKLEAYRQGRWQPPKENRW